MLDEPTPTPTPAPAPRRWLQHRRNQLGIALLLLLAWSFAANQWTEKGCDAFPQSYGLTITHFGEPAENEGCEDESGGPQYTDQYYN